MKFRTFGKLCVCALLVAGAAGAHAQLVFGSTSPSTSNPAGMYLDVASGQVTTLWMSASQKKINGLASDPASGRLYSNDAARLSYWEYESVGTPPTLIAGMYRTNDFIAFTATGVDGLAFANGLLYGATSFGSTTYKRGIYQVATTHDGASTPHCVMTPLWLDPTAQGTSSGLLKLEGLDYNAADGLFYATQTVDTTSTGGTFTRGVYTIDAFGTGAITKIADFPDGRTGLDGLAIGSGRLWMTEHQPASSRIAIYPYDLVTSQYETPIYVPLTDTSQRATGAAWAPYALVPEPGTCAALSLLAVILAGKQRR